MSYHKKEFQKLNDDFENKSSTLLNDDNPSIDQFEYVLDSYNAIISYAVIDYERKKDATKEFIQSTIRVNRITLQRCYEKLKLPIILPGKLLSTIHYLPQLKDNSSANLGVNSDSNKMPNSQNTGSNSADNQSHSHANMPQTTEKYLKIIGPTLSYKYSGDPLKLNSFITDIKIAYSLAQNDETKGFCLLYVKSRLDGRAEECIPENCESIDELIKALKEKIKPDNSSIIEGKILALRLIQGDYTKFAADAEKLGEALRRSLIVEGLTKQKSEELTIRRMVELCRKTSKVDVVKSVLESTKYDSAADVIATFISQSDIARREYKESQTNKPKKNYSNGNKNTNDNGQRNKNFNKNRGNFNNGGNRSNENQSNGNYRGRNNQNGQNQQQRGRNNNRPNRQEHTIRLVSGTRSGPAAEQTPQQQQEQFFRLEG